MKITPMPDRKAANLLGVSYDTIRNAVKRGDLTRVPQAGLIQHVAEEQVLLFEGMSRIVREKLSSDKLKKWHTINDAIAPVFQEVPHVEQLTSIETINENVHSIPMPKSKVTKDGFLRYVRAKKEYYNEVEEFVKTGVDGNFLSPSQMQLFLTP